MKVVRDATCLKRFSLIHFSFLGKRRFLKCMLSTADAASSASVENCTKMPS